MGYKCKLSNEAVGYCSTHGEPMTICTHAAAELEQRVEDQEALIRVYAKQVADQRDRLAQAEAARFALESLTPGGSEYVNDPARCVAYIREKNRTQHQAIVKFKRERDQAEAAATGLPFTLILEWQENGR